LELFSKKKKEEIENEIIYEKKRISWSIAFKKILKKIIFERKKIQIFSH